MVCVRGECGGFLRAGGRWPGGLGWRAAGELHAVSCSNSAVLCRLQGSARYRGENGVLLDACSSTVLCISLLLVYKWGGQCLLSVSNLVLLIKHLLFPYSSTMSCIDFTLLKNPYLCSICV